jgi:hypothetical protein
MQWLALINLEMQFMYVYSKCQVASLCSLCAAVVCFGHTTQEQPCRGTVSKLALFLFAARTALIELVTSAINMMNQIKHYFATSAAQALTALKSLCVKHAQCADKIDFSILLSRYVAAVVPDGLSASPVVRVNDEHVPPVLRAGAICSARELAYATGGVHIVVCEEDANMEDVSTMLHLVLKSLLQDLVVSKLNIS